MEDTSTLIELYVTNRYLQLNAEASHFRCDSFTSFLTYSDAFVSVVASVKLKHQISCTPSAILGVVLRLDASHVIHPIIYFASDYIATYLLENE